MQTKLSYMKYPYRRQKITLESLLDSLKAYGEFEWLKLDGLELFHSL